MSADDTNQSKLLCWNLREPNELAGITGWDIDFRQLEGGDPRAKITVLPTANLNILKIELNQAIHQTGLSPAEFVTFGLTYHRLLRRWNGKQMSAPSMLDFGSRREYEAVSHRRFIGHTISIRADFVQAAARKLGLPTPSELSQEGIVPLAADNSERPLIAYAESLLSEGGEFNGCRQEAFVATLIEAAASGPEFEDQSRLLARSRAVRLAVEFVKERSSNEPIRIGKICESINVTWRTLDRGFREEFGVGPKAYFDRVRLGRVRSALLSSRGQFGIAEIANQWGYWHMGQFARDYRAMFGELPSSTVDHSR